MYKGGSKLLPLILVIIVTIVAIIAMVSVGRALLNRNASDVVVDDFASRALLEANVDSSVRMTVRGPIVADEEFNSYQIQISPSERRMTTYEGYQGQVIEQRQASNTMRGYEEFIHALDRVGFTNEERSNNTLDDVRGVCASGRLYTFEILQAQSVVKELWISSCRAVPASFGGNATASRDLFLKQIADSSTLLRDLNL